MGARRSDLVAVQAGLRIGVSQMSVMDWIGIALAAGLFIYLLIALLFPERFE
jgi:K+-transporting ATPase KdpF subunit